VGQIAHVGAAVFFADGHTQNAEIAHLAPQIHRELVVAVDFSCTRRDFGGSKLLNGFTQSGDIVAMIES
jgi:hypothetical protein